jgi:hypothetical protein
MQISLVSITVKIFAATNLGKQGEFLKALQILTATTMPIRH